MAGDVETEQLLFVSEHVVLRPFVQQLHRLAQRVARGGQRIGHDAEVGAVAAHGESELTMGMTVIDWWRVTERKANATVCRGIDADGFFALLMERIARLN